MAKKSTNIVEELQRRVKEVENQVLQAEFSLPKICFDKQLQFLEDRNRFKSATCSRRAGKTKGIALDMVNTCKSESNIICQYVTLTFRNARSIMWGDLKQIIDKYKLNVKTDETRLIITFLDTKSEIRLGGAKDEAEIEKYRGHKYRKFYIDEAQSFRPYLKYFIEDIILPCLRDLRGTLSVTGTPGPLLAGVFYEISHSELWSQHHWTAFDNPHMLELDKTLTEERALRGIDENDPGYIRETFGKWVEDLDSLVFKFSADKNIYAELPKESLSYIFGIDIGWDDCDAIAVVGYSHITNNCYLVEESIKGKQTISALADEVKRLKAKYNPVRMVMDAGALGKKIQEEIRLRHSLVIDAAEKHRKLEFIELMNDDLRTGKFKALKGSRFQEDCALVQWDKDAPKNKRAISDSYHSDANDATLYSWRECRHYFQVPVKQPKAAGEEYMRQLEEQEAQKLQEKLEAQKTGEDIVNFSDLGIDDSDDYSDIY